jgi:hypothetical protein
MKKLLLVLAFQFVSWTTYAANCIVGLDEQSGTAKALKNLYDGRSCGQTEWRVGVVSQPSLDASGKVVGIKVRDKNLDYDPYINVQGGRCAKSEREWVSYLLSEFAYKIRYKIEICGNSYWLDEVEFQR